MYRIKFIILATSFIFLTQCNTTTQWVQINHLKSSDCTELNDGFVFSNDSISIRYAFGGEDGSMAFAITNNLSVPIYIDWKKCSYIINGNKKDYYSETVTVSSKTSTTGSSTGYYFNNNKYSWLNNYLVSRSRSSSNSTSITSKQERITFIPPSSTIFYSVVKLNPELFEIKGATREVRTVGGKEVNVRETLDYMDNNTPYKLRNFLTFSTKESFENEHFIDNHFFLGSIQDVRDTAVIENYTDNQGYKGATKDKDLGGKAFYVKYAPN